ncbi:MAG: winged helix-turn-helix domain-containing protein [Chloroflexi bacterium]|nr:winged helix-turn-helix domain-containing protein [Chloroflexota bacterium]
MSRYTQREVAHAVLRLSARPMKAAEIVEVGRANRMLTGNVQASIDSLLSHEVGVPDSPFLRVKGGFGLKEWRDHPDPELRRLVREAEVERALRRWLTRVREVDAGLASAPSSDVLCIWTELCYRLGLADDGCALFARVHPDEVDPWLLKRAQWFAKLLSRQAS